MLSHRPFRALYDKFTFQAVEFNDIFGFCVREVVAGNAVLFVMHRIADSLYERLEAGVFRHGNNGGCG